MVYIRQGSWIAIGSLVVAGVTIGEGAVVSAGSVVLKDVPANCLVRGNPATFVYEIFRDSGSDKGSVGVIRARGKMLRMTSEAVVANAGKANYPDGAAKKHPVGTGALPNS